jgi:hypothetical protein
MLALTNVGDTVVEFLCDRTYDHFDKFAVRQVISFFAKGVPRGYLGFF